MTKQQIRKRLIEDGVAKLNRAGYPQITQDNVMADPIYATWLVYEVQRKRGKSVAQDAVIVEIEREVYKLIWGV